MGIFMTTDGARVIFLALAITYFILFIDLFLMLLTDGIERNPTQKVFMWMYTASCLAKSLGFMFWVGMSGDNPLLDKSIFLPYAWIMWGTVFLLLAPPVMAGTGTIFSNAINGKPRKKEQTTNE